MTRRHRWSDRWKSTLRTVMVPGILSALDTLDLVTEDTPRCLRPLRGRQRWLAAAIGGGLVGLLGVAAMLTPSERGHGTHQQLGLPPCSFYVLFGRRCPTCGATTAVARSVRGDWRGALGANVGGTVFAALAMVAAPWSLLSAACGRWIGPAPNGPAAACIAGVIFAIMLADWAVRLSMGAR